MAHYTCVMCRGQGILEVHHIIPQSENGPDDLQNAVPLCPNCHTQYGDNPHLRKEIRERRNWWWDHCADQDAHPDIRVFYAAIQPYLERVDQHYEEFKEGIRSVDDLRAVVVDMKVFQLEQLSSASTVDDIVRIASSST